MQRNGVLTVEDDGTMTTYDTGHEVMESRPKLKLEKIVSTANVATLLEKEHLEEIASHAVKGYRADELSRRAWMTRMQQAMALALQAEEIKNTPWDGAANVKIPSMTIAALSFNSRVLPALVNNDNLIKMRVVGADPEGLKLQRAKRVELYMSYQILEEDQEWVNEMDTLLMYIPTVGCGFKKVYMNPETGVINSVFTRAENLCMDYYAASVEKATRITELCDVSKNTIVTRQRLGMYIDCDIDWEAAAPDKLTNPYPTDDTTPPSVPTGHQRILEQHTYLDLDNDGYDEPYIITIHERTEKVLCIQPRFGMEDIVFNPKREVVTINPEHYYTRYVFLPSPDGSIYGMGWGQLLTPLIKTLNTLINITLNSATLTTMPFGFVGRGANIREGELSLKPGRLSRLSVSGDDLRRNLYIPDFKGPSSVMLNMIELLLRYVERTSNTNEVLTGDLPGQNTPATTSVNALEQAQKVLNRSFGRVFESCTREFRRRFTLNKQFFNADRYAEVLDTLVQDLGLDDPAALKAKLAEDFSGSETDIRPSSDASIAGAAQRLAKAEAVLRVVNEGIGGDRFEAQKRVLQALNVEGIDKILPMDDKGQPAIQPPTDPKIDLMATELELEGRHKQLKLDAEIAVLRSQSIKMEADAIKSIASAEALQEGSQINEYRAHLDMLKLSLEKQSAKRKQEEQGNGPVDEGGVPGVEEQPSIEGVLQAGGIPPG